MDIQVIIWICGKVRRGIRISAGTHSPNGPTWISKARGLIINKMPEQVRVLIAARAGVKERSICR
ncbi:uncharacterized protein BDV14DRAFT_170179 [Aspergillus stella-maris]|uniref:uncharacterized protein n=1 Tax=Aspergillus stella-maris TaxID=1810926 RepID=UPI003CCC9A4F